MLERVTIAAWWLAAPPTPTPTPAPGAGAGAGGHTAGGNGGVTVPNPAPKPIPGSGSVLDIIAYIKWGALAGIVACFFAGLIAFTAGRIVDNRRAGNVGALMMIAALGGAILYAIGYFLIRSFTHSG